MEQDSEYPEFEDLFDDFVAEEVAEDAHEDPEAPAPKEEPSSSSSVHGQPPPGASNSKNVNLMSLNDTKAGMEGLDVEKINEIIQKTSEGSRFYEHKKQAQARLDKRVAQIKKQMESFTESQIRSSERKMTELAQEMEKTRDLSRVIVHIDMDAFFAAVEMRDNPALRNVPMAVGGLSMLSTSNYLARKFGVRAAMPGFIAKKLCPQLVLVPGSYSKYRVVSEQVQEILGDYDPNFSSMSLDEAYLDITDVLSQRNAEGGEGSVTPMDIVAEIRARIEEKTQLTASAGIAPNGLLAKIAGDSCKPNNQYFLEPTIPSIKAFIEGLPIRKIGGIGAVTEQLLKALDINIVADLWAKRSLIHLLFSPIQVKFLMGVALGLGSSFMSSESSGEDRKSYSCERTFKGTSQIQFLKDKTRSCAESLEKDLKDGDVRGRQVTLKLKTVDFQVKTRVKNLLEPTSDGQVIFEAAWSIFEGYLNEYKMQNKELELRLIGVRVSGLKLKESCDMDGKRQTRIDTLLKKVGQNAQIAPKVVPKVANELEVTSKSLEEVAGAPEEAVPSTSSTATAPGMVECPICGKILQEEAINGHVDECLNRDAVKEILRSDKGDQSGPLPRKRLSETKEEGSEVKRSRMVGGVKTNPIESYFIKK